jgi:hypothetical protein
LTFDFGEVDSRKLDRLIDSSTVGLEAGAAAAAERETGVVGKLAEEGVMLGEAVSLASSWGGSFSFAFTAST